MGTDAQIECYLKIMSAQLGSATLAEREKICGEIAAHVQDSVEGKSESVDSVLTRLGPPEQLGERYRGILATCQASRSCSPAILLTASFRQGILGIVAALVGLAGYWLGGLLLVSSALTLGLGIMQAKPHTPAPTGTYIDIFKLVVGGCLSLLCSTILLQATLRLLRRRQSPI